MLRIHLGVVVRVNCLLVDSNRVIMNLGQRGRESRGAIPSGLAEEVEEEVATMQRVRSAGGEVRRSGGDAEATVKSVAASRRWQHPLSRSIRVREWSMGRLVAQENLVPRPPPPFYGAVRWGPTNHGAVGRLRSGRESKSPIGGNQTDILPLDLTL